MNPYYDEEMFRQIVNKLYGKEVILPGKEFKIDVNVKVKEPAPTVDQLLDQYNDYMTLHKMFGDKEYLNVAKEIMNQLRGV